MEDKTTPQTTPTKGDQKKKTLGMIAGAVGFIVAYLLVQQFFPKTPTFDKVMMQVANEINASCPILVDADTRLDNVAVYPANVFQYNYTLINDEKAFVDTLYVKEQMEPFVVNVVRTNPDMQYLRDNESTLKYMYRDKNGEYLFRITVTPKQYQP